MKTADVLIIPGVGAFKKAMVNIEPFKDIIIEHVEDGKPILGICLGLQILFTESEESPGVMGLNIIPGKVVRLSAEKVPHMGWNKIKIKKECPLLNDIKDGYFYFAHSYYAKPKDWNVVAATTYHGSEIPAVICHKNIYATQFHPEKSGTLGLKILNNFVELVK